jgi:hypothetical protein
MPDLFARISFVEAEAVAEWNLALFFFQPDADAQIVRHEILIIIFCEVDHPTIRGGAETVLGLADVVEKLRLEHEEHRFARHGTARASARLANSLRVIVRRWRVLRVGSQCFRYIYSRLNCRGCI